MCRRLRSILPATPASLQPILVNPEDTQRRFKEKQDKHNMCYDRNAITRAGISVGNQLLLRKNTGGYQIAVFIENADTTRSYNVRTKDGAVYRRTNRHIKKPRHYVGDVPRMAAPEALRYDIQSEPKLPVTRRPMIPTVSPPNHPAEVPVPGVPVVPSEVNHLPLRSRYVNRSSDTKLELCFMKRICDSMCACVEDGRSKSSSDKIAGFFSNFLHRFG